MSIENLKILSTLGISISILFVINNYLYSFGLRVISEYFKAFDLSNEKVLGTTAIFMFIFGGSLQMLIPGKSINYHYNYQIAILFTIFIGFYCILKYRLDKFIMCSKPYKPRPGIYVTFMFFSIAILFISGYFVVGAIIEYMKYDYVSQDNNLRIIYLTKLLIWYILSLLDGGYILGFATTFNYNLYCFYCNKLIKYSLFESLDIYENKMYNNKNYQKIIGYLIEGNKESYMIKVCNPCNSDVLSIKKNMVDMITLGNKIKKRIVVIYPDYH